MNKTYKSINGVELTTDQIEMSSKELWGTGLQGYITCSYETLEKVLGEPQGAEVWSDGKIQVEWAIKTKEGQVITIYDWKIDCFAHKNLEWNIGGHSQGVLATLVQLFAHENVAIEQR